MRRLSFAAAPLALALALAAAAATAPGVARAQAEEEGDPLEGLNRAIFGFNRGFDRFVLRPVSVAYGTVVPRPGRDMVYNFLNNLRGPAIFVNDLLQGERERAGITLSRFVINSVVGLGGVFDVASEAGFVYHYEDFGQTLGSYGIATGPYLVLPLLGPSSLRDAAGLAVDAFALDPFGAYNPVGLEIPFEARLARSGTEAVDLRYRFGGAIDDLYSNSLDPYATARTVYRQRRAAEIRNQNPDARSRQDYDAIFDEDPNE